MREISLLDAPSLMSSELHGNLVVDPYLEINGTSKAENRNAPSAFPLPPYSALMQPTPFTEAPWDREKGCTSHQVMHVLESAILF